MQIKERGICPFRVHTDKQMGGCVLQMGRETLCYSQDTHPLMYQNDHYSCPLLSRLTLSVETYINVERMIEYVSSFQDTRETYMNLWPLLSGIAKMKDARTEKGKEIEQLSKKVKKQLEEIVLDFS